RRHLPVDQLVSSLYLHRAKRGPRKSRCLPKWSLDRRGWLKQSLCVDRFPLRTKVFATPCSDRTFDTNRHLCRRDMRTFGLQDRWREQACKQHRQESRSTVHPNLLHQFLRAPKQRVLCRQAYRLTEDDDQIGSASKRQWCLVQVFHPALLNGSRCCSTLLGFASRVQLEALAVFDGAQLSGPTVSLPDPGFSFSALELMLEPRLVPMMRRDRLSDKHQGWFPGKASCRRSCPAELHT